MKQVASKVGRLTPEAKSSCGEELVIECGLGVGQLNSGLQVVAHLLAHVVGRLLHAAAAGRGSNYLQRGD